jgi:signal transduction histidine kinase
MLTYKGKQHQRQHFSLAVRVSFMLVIAAILPLLVIEGVIEFSSRPALIKQVSREMETDARTRTQLIDSYFAERMIDSEAVSRLPPIQRFLAGDSSSEAAARDSLATGHVRGSQYQNWSLFNLQGHLLLYYPAIPQRHGNSFIQPDALQKLQTSKQTLISNVFYNSASNEAYIDIYAPVVTSSYTVVGVLRTTFDLHYIWKIVDDEAGASGSGSYAFILDENGVRIAMTNSHPDAADMTHSSLLFTATAPISPALQQQIDSEHLYGLQEGQKMRVLAETLSTDSQPGNATPSIFHMIPAGQHEEYLGARWSTYTVPWTYHLVSPLSTIAMVVDQQLQITRIIATVVLFLAIAIGIFAGRRFALPIMHSIEAQQVAYKRQQQLGQLKDQFLVNVSHELRTPLTEVYGYLELLLIHGDQLDTLTKTTFLKHAMSGCEELTALINNVLDAIHTDDETKPLRVQHVGVAEAVHDVLDQFDPRTVGNYTIHVKVPEMLSVEADPQSVRQVLRNLLSNAFKYAPPQTQLVISATLGDTDCQSGKDDGKVSICVKDQGPGITTGEKDLLFNKFIRLQRDLSGSVRGTGLGLYISKQLVEGMGGHIWVESKGVPGEGSSFCFTLPTTTNSKIVDSN